MIEAALAGLTLGVANSLRCTATCLPIISVQLLCGRRTVGNSVLIVAVFSLGRLVSYLAISTGFYFAAAYLSFFEGPYVKGSATLLIGSVMMYHCYMTLFGGSRPSCGKFSQRRILLLLGSLTGFSACLPLLLVLSIYSATSLFSTYVAVSMFWVGSSALPLAATLPFAGLSRVKNTSVEQRLTSIGGLAGGVLGLIFVAAGLQTLLGQFLTLLDHSFG